jgi:Cd2+/Zn2+-exporting ATPase
MAMGGLGSDAAIETADVVIMKDAPSKVADAIKIAQKTHTIVCGKILFLLWL